MICAKGGNACRGVVVARTKRVTARVTVASVSSGFAVPTFVLNRTLHLGTSQRTTILRNTAFQLRYYTAEKTRQLQKGHAFRKRQDIFSLRPTRVAALFTRARPFVGRCRPRGPIHPVLQQSSEPHSNVFVIPRVNKVEGARCLLHVIPCSDCPARLAGAKAGSK